MVEEAKNGHLSWGQFTPHVLVVEQDVDYGQSLLQELRSRSIRAKHMLNVDAFLDLNCQERVHLVSLDIDAIDPANLDSIVLLRTHFGEGPGTRIVASSRFMHGAFAMLLEKRGADKSIAKPTAPEALAAALEAELRIQMKANEFGQAKAPDRSE
ncbi:MAG: hypothetical protein AAFY73_15320 [Pseudomonadota bacterium]